VLQVLPFNWSCRVKVIEDLFLPATSKTLTTTTIDTKLRNEGKKTM
jgi:hypothetical protein